MTLPVPIAGASWRVPEEARFLYRRSATHRHQGIDIAAPKGTPIWSVFNGVVETSAPPGRQGFDGYGRTLVVRRADGVRAMYGHLDRALVDVGDRVSEGQQIATVGTSRGTVERPNLQFRESRAHLHFETARRPYPLRKERDRIDPLGVEPMPDPETETTHDEDDVARWFALNELIGKLYLAIPADRRAGEPTNLLNSWRAEYAAAKTMGGDFRRSRLKQWIDAYNTQRARLYQAGLRDLPPVARDRTTLEEVTAAVRENVVEPIADAASSGFNWLLIGGLVWLYFEAQKRDAAQQVIHVEMAKP